MSFFNEVFGGKKRFRELDVDFLKKHNYGVKNVFDGFNFDDFKYFDTVVNNKNNYGYKVYGAYSGEEAKEDFFNILDDAFDKCIDYAGGDVLFEFVDRELYIYSIESDNYFIFGSKSVLKQLDDYQYSDEYARARLRDIKDQDRVRYYQWLYDTYQNLYC